MFIKGRHQSGEYLLNGTTSLTDTLRDWIVDHRFTLLEDPANRLAKQKGRLSHTLYEVSIGDAGERAVMKVFRIDQRYKLGRRVDLFLHALLKDYNKIAFKNAYALFDAGLPVTEPLAFWSHAHSWWDRRSYLLYRKIESDETVADFCARQLTGEKELDQKGACILYLYEEVVAALRLMHERGFRHGDPHLNNILVRSGAAPGNRLCFIDYDKCHRARILWHPWKHFFDLRDVATVSGDKDRDAATLFLELYCQDPSSWQRLAVRFWSKERTR